MTVVRGSAAPSTRLPSFSRKWSAALRGPDTWGGGWGAVQMGEVKNEMLKMKTARKRAEQVLTPCLSGCRADPASLWPAGRVPQPASWRAIQWDQWVWD